MIRSALVAALALIGLTACNGASLDPPKNSPRKVATAVTATPEGGELGILVQDTPGGESQGSDCQMHKQCDLPLRCVDYICSVPPAVDGKGAESAPKVVFNAGTSAERVVPVELATNDRDRQLGLMFRTRMHPDWGMLFIFNEADIRSFWMRNTYLPLDMVYFNNDGTIINTRQNARPLDEGPRYTSTRPARFVLELNAGYVERYGLQAGQSVKLVDVPGDHPASLLLGTPK